MERDKRVYVAGTFDTRHDELETVPEQFKDRLFHIHNPQVTLMRTTVEENQAIARWIADKLNTMQGEVRFLIPEHGVSMLDAEGQAFYDPVADAALFDTLEQNVVQTDNTVESVTTEITMPAYRNIKY